MKGAGEWANWVRERWDHASIEKTFEATLPAIRDEAVEKAANSAAYALSGWGVSAACKAYVLDVIRNACKGPEAPVLKACPFCGGEGRVKAGDSAWVQCATCHGGSGVFDTEAAAIAAWNKRA